MRSLPKSSLPILITLVFFLSAAATAQVTAQQSPKPLTQNRKSTPDDNQAHVQATAVLAQHSPQAASSSNSKAASTQNSKRVNNPYLQLFWGVISSQVFFNAVLTIATIFIAFFNYQLLFLERPFLVVERPVPKGFTPEERVKAADEDAFRIVAALCPFRNVGKSPAIILQIAVKMKLATDLPLPPDFDDCEETTAIKDPIVPTGVESEFYVLFDNYQISNDDWARVAKNKIKIVLYGKVVYKWVLWKRYTTNFGFVYEPPHSGLGPGNKFRFGRAEYNTRT